MSHIKNAYLSTIKMALAALEAHKNQLSAEEKVVLRSFQEVVSVLDAEKKALSEKTKLRMREYRQTPDGYDASIEANRKYARKRRESQEI